MKRKRIRYLAFVLALLVLAACSVEKRVARKYQGEGREVLFLDFGEPHKVVDLGDGVQRFIYVKEKFVRETEIGTGRPTLDPRVSPSFIKEETWRFDINAMGEIIQTSYEKKQK